ncbi:glycine cleavage system aminomethyltransferase T [compost metagenome]
MRGGANLFADTEGKTHVGKVTSGGFGPTVDGPIAMGYVDASHTDNGTTVYAEVRGKYLPVVVAALPFVKQTYKR